MILKINNLSVEVNQKKIISGLSLTLKDKQLSVIMGPNGSGKSSLFLALMGHPFYKITQGKILLDNKNITFLPADEKYKLGLFLSFQKPTPIPGLCYLNFLKNIYLKKYPKKTKKILIKQFLNIIRQKSSELEISEELIKKDVNFGLSGGEQKKMEMLTLSIISPKFAVLDEIDTGLDIDALNLISNQIKFLKQKMGIVLISHNARIFKALCPDQVFIMVKGKIIQSGGYEIINKIEKYGFKIFY